MAQTTFIQIELILPEITTGESIGNSNYQRIVIISEDNKKIVLEFVKSELDVVIHELEKIIPILKDDLVNHATFEANQHPPDIIGK